MALGSFANPANTESGPLASKFMQLSRHPKGREKNRVTFGRRGREFQLGFDEEAKANAVKNVSGVQIQAPSPWGLCSSCGAGPKREGDTLLISALKAEL